MPTPARRTVNLALLGTVGILVVLGGLVTPAGGSPTAEATATTPPIWLPLAVRRDLTAGYDPVLRRVARRTMGMSGRIDEWDWEGGIAMVGLMHAYEATGDPAILDHVEQWVDARLAAGVPLTAPAFRAPDCAARSWPAAGVRHPNHGTPTWAVLMLHDHRPKGEYLAIIERTLDFLATDACRVDGGLAHAPDQLWDDTLIVSVPLLARYGARFDQSAYLELAVDEVLIHAAHLQDPVNGTWFHGYSFATGDHLSAAHWARGNGWAALATAELLRWLPRDHPRRAEVARVLERQLRGLIAVQDPGGLWHTVLDRPDFYLETSGSAAIAAALLRTGAPGWPASDLAAIGERARAAVYRQVAPDGTVTGVSSGTGVAPSLDVYNRVPTDSIQPYGQGLFLIMASGTR